MFNGTAVWNVNTVKDLAISAYSGVFLTQAPTLQDKIVLLISHRSVTYLEIPSLGYRGVYINRIVFMSHDL